MRLMIDVMLPLVPCLVLAGVLATCAIPGPAVAGVLLAGVAQGVIRRRVSSFRVLSIAAPAGGPQGRESWPLAA